MRIQDSQLQLALPDHYPDTSPAHLRAAAVLLPLIPREQEDAILFTVRSQALRKHKGQIAFPGGKRDPEDRDLADTALRETHEEIGIAPPGIQLVGALPPFPTHTGFYIHPYVGRLDWPLEFTPQYAEIDEIFQVPLRHLLDPTIYRMEEREVDGVIYPIHYYQYEQHTIWGITAHILHGFLAGLAPEHLR